MAKHLLLPLLVFLLHIDLQAQSLEVWTDKEEILCPLGTLVETIVYVKNTSDEPVTFKVKRTGEKLMRSQETFFRLDGKTIASRINEATNTVTLQPNEKYTGLVAAFSSGFKQGKATVSYTVCNVASKSDKASVSLKYNVSSDAPTDRLYVSEEISISFMYPNPAVQYAEFQYKIPSNIKSLAEVRIHNVLGKPLGSYELDPQENILRVQFKDWEPGVYFYMLVLDDKTVASKKFIVKR